MTLALSSVSRHAVVQATDRLISRGGKAEDPLANKNVVYCARDALVTISYTGLAFLNGIRTDDWIARKLRGEAEWVPGEPSAGPGLRFTKAPQWLDIGQAVHTLRSHLDLVFSGPEKPNTSYSLAIGLLGWQWKLTSGKARPIAWAIDKPGGASTATATPLLPHHWHESKFILTALPKWATQFGKDDRRALFDELRPALGDPVACEQILARGVRTMSSREPELIGPHILTVSIPAPQGTAEAHVCFRPYGGNGTPPGPVGPLAYMPWMVLGDDLLVPPSAIQGTYGPMIFEGGKAKVVAEGVAPEP